MLTLGGRTDNLPGMTKPLRLGFVGAGNNTRRRHIPGFRDCDEIEFVAVANSSRESSEAAAAEFGIAHACGNWAEVVHRDDVDAVVIGTWPNLHAEVTCAALAAGKHVLCEARMARDLAEATRMFDALKASTGLVAQLVPTPMGMQVGEKVGQLVRDHYIGDLREVVVTASTDAVWDFSQPLHWRQQRQLSGLNTLTLGIVHEAVMRWLPEPVRVLAQQQLYEPNRPVPEAGRYEEVTVPDSVSALVEFKNDVRAVYRISGVNLFGPGHRIELYGSRGTVVVEFGETERVFAGRIGDAELAEVDIAAEDRGSWSVEADFVKSIRDGKKVTRTTFGDGVRYMAFTEAVLRSSESGDAVDWPIEPVAHDFETAEPVASAAAP